MPSQSPPGFLYIGGSGDDRINAIGGINPIFFVGETKSSDVTNLGRPLTTFLNGSSDALIGSVSPFLNSISLRYFGGSGDDSATSVAIDHQGRLVIAGKTTSPDFPLQNPLFNKLSGPKEFWTGRNFIASITVFISADIPGSALLSLSSSDASRLLVGLNGSGTSQISVPVSYKGQVNNSKIAFDLIGLADNGETTVTISLDGYADQILRIRFGPVVVRPFGALPDGLPGQVNVSDVVPISPAFGVIDDTGQFNQGLYGYPFPGSPLERIDFSLSDPSLADLPWSSRVFPGQNGDCHLRTIDNGQLTIKAKSSLLPVFGPDTLTFLINRHKIVIRSFTAGKNLSAKVASIYDRFPPDTNAVSLLTSKDPNRLCLVIGENCVTSGFSNLVRALDDSGSVTVTYSTEYRSGETDIQIKPGKIFVQELPSVPT